jgi:opacity protein-like surface antigen
MLSIRRAVVLGAALLCSSAALADGFKGGRGSMKDEVYSAPQASWYLRIDGTYATHDDPDMVETKIYDLTDTRIDDTWSIGGGIGRYFSRNLRGDITWDHRFDTDVRATNLDSVVGGARRFSLESDLILANLYYDFAVGERITPYIGVGLGAVYHRTGGGIGAVSCACNETFSGNEEWHVAGALMSGFSLAIGRRSEPVVSIKDSAPAVETRTPFHLDFGYRFLYLGEAKTGTITDSVSATSRAGIVVGDIHAHEFRLGLRWDVR